MDMDLWSVEEVIAWLIEEGFGEYENTIVKNRVDGYVVSQLFEQRDELSFPMSFDQPLPCVDQLVHLDNGDWDDLGIHSKVHQKRLELLLEPFKTR